MYIKIVNRSTKKSQLLECDGLNFYKKIIDRSNEEDSQESLKNFITLFEIPKEKIKYEALIITLKSKGDITKYFIPESTMFILNDNGKTIDVLKCDEI